MAAHKPYYIGLMSGTSLDGIDGVLVEFEDNGTVRVLNHAGIDYPKPLKNAFLDLFTPADNEIQRMEQARQQRNTLACELIKKLVAKVPPSSVVAIADHGQTIRHFPEARPPYTLQLHHGPALAEHSGIDCVVDFRSQDIAAGGQGAPLVPAFHQAFFSHDTRYRVIVNIGGIANLSLLSPGDASAAAGFDTGPGNTLMDSWCLNQAGLAYDDQGRWAAGGRVREALLTHLLDDPYFQLEAPKSTGREYFNPDWLQLKLATGNFTELPAADIQACLSALTAQTICLGIQQACAQAGLDMESDIEAVYLCGGGAHNLNLVEQIKQISPVAVHSTGHLGVPPGLVEATAFAWLGRQAVKLQAVDLGRTTGARHNNVLGAVYRAST